MYSSLSNNPFIDRPDADSSAESSSSRRYPDINTFNQATGGTPGGGGSGYPQQQPQQQSVGYDGSWNDGGYGGGGYGSAFSGVGAQPTGFYGQQQPQPQQQQSYQSGYASPAPQVYPQPTGFYGQQQQQQPSYGQQQSFQQQPQQQFGYPLQQYQGMQYQSADYGGGGGGLQPYGSQQQQQHPQQQTGPYLNLSEFDPLIGSAATGGQGGGTNLGTAPPGATHPREYIYSNKLALEKWDASAWRGAVNAFVKLQEAWESHRKRCTDAQLRPYVSLAETTNLQNMQKEAERNIDTVAAATLQMKEVNESYRLSRDFAGRDRVRQALNGALTNLPPWPPQS